MCYRTGMQSNLPALRLPQLSMETAVRAAESIRPLVRIDSPTLTTACRQAGMSLELAQLCGGLLASVIEDLVAIGHLARTDFERTRRLQRVLVAAEEPARSALRIAVAASPVNGRAAVAHYDMVCSKPERGKLAWLLGLDTEAAYKYGKQHERRAVGL